MSTVVDKERKWVSPKILLRYFELFSILLLLTVIITEAEGSSISSPSSTPAEIDLLAAEWDTFYSKIDHDLFTLLDLELEEEEQFTEEEKAELARMIRKLKRAPFMEGSTDLNLWLTVMLASKIEYLESNVETLQWKHILALIEQRKERENLEAQLVVLEIDKKKLESQLPENAPFASGSGPGSESERFTLWTECRQLLPLVTLYPQDDSFEESVTAAVESRLRGTHLYFDGLGEAGILWIQVNSESGLFGINVRLSKPLFDPITRLNKNTLVTEGAYSSFGTGPPEYIRSVLADHLDKFLADYLRVNADAC